MKPNPIVPRRHGSPSKKWRLHTRNPVSSTVSRRVCGPVLPMPCRTWAEFQALRELTATLVTTAGVSPGVQLVERSWPNWCSTEKRKASTFRRSILLDSPQMRSVVVGDGNGVVLMLVNSGRQTREREREREKARKNHPKTSDVSNGKGQRQDRVERQSRASFFFPNNHNLTFHYTWRHVGFSRDNVVIWEESISGLRGRFHVIVSGDITLAQTVRHR